MIKRALLPLCTAVLAMLGGSTANAYNQFPGGFNQEELNQEKAPDHGVFVDPSEVDPNACIWTPVNPFIATDNDRIFLDEGSARPGMQALLTGYRYNDAAPTRSLPQGEGREAIYCGCQRVNALSSPDPDGVVRTSPFIRVPDDAPSGHYSVELLPPDTDCSSGGIRAVCNASLVCVNPSLTVAPSHVVTTLEGLTVNTNAEDDENNPAEMQFLFASASGTAFGDADTLVKWSGTFPAGAKGSAHVTNADHTFLRVRLPLFTGRESQMSAAECREECVALPANAEAACTQTCDLNETLGRYNDSLEIGFGGFELDSSPSKAWGVVAGLAVTAGTCYAASSLGQPCGIADVVGPGALGAVTAKAVNNLIKDDDDNLGSAGVTLGRLNNDWGIGVPAAPIAMAGQDTGSLALNYRTQRMAAPSLLSYAVKLRSVRIDDGYEEGDCHAPNEIFMHARAELQTGQSSQGAPRRLPEGNGVFLANEGETLAIDTFITQSGAILPENAPESPFLYVEVSVWERDEHNDLLGVSAMTHALAPILTGFSDPVAGVSPEGFFTRRARFTQTVRVNGYAGSDNHCHSIFPHDWDSQAEQGSATITYDIDITWLPVPVLR